MTNSQRDISTDISALSGEDSVRLTINLSALKENFRAMQAKSPSAITSAVVKANAYGLGIAQVVPALLSVGCEVFFVATLAEALTCRTHAPDAHIYCFNGYNSKDDEAYRSYRVRPCLSSLAQIADWQKACAKNGNAAAAVHIDTGFNRLGLDGRDLMSLHETPALFDGWQLSLIMSHLACADIAEHPMNAAQLERFRDALLFLPKAPASLANSGGVWLGPDYHFDLTRCGISLYGGAPQTSDTALTTVVTAHAHILQCRDITAGESIGYGAQFVAERDMRIAIISVGYADGFLRAAGRSAPPFTHVYLHDFPAPIIGRVSMDMLAIDISELPHITCGNEVEFIGANAKIDDLAKGAGTIAYELLTRLGNRYKRVYV